MFLSRHIEFGKIVACRTHITKIKLTWKVNTSRKEHFVWTETLRVFEGLLFLSKDKILGQNYGFWCTGAYLKMGENFSKMVTTRAIGRNQFRLFIALIISSCRPKISANCGCHLGLFPPDCYLNSYEYLSKSSRNTLILRDIPLHESPPPPTIYAIRYTPTYIY
jgi:hypothetical protein